MLRIQLLFLLLLAATAIQARQTRNVQSQQQQVQSQGYLVPIVRGYANNQILGMKEVLALGQLLGRTVVLTGLIESPAEQQPDSYPRVIPFDDVFSRDGIEALQPVTYLPDLRASGWGGELDLVVFFAGQGSDELWLRRWLAAFNVTTSSTPHAAMHGFGCNEDWVEKIRARVQGLAVVGMSSFEGIVGAHPRRPGSEWRYEEHGRRQTLCQKAYVEVTRVLDKSAHIQQLAQRFISQQLRSARFVALHVRPFPDSCLKVWQRRHWNQQEAERKGVCLHAAGKYSLHEVLGPAMRAAMQTVGPSAPLFVMADPRIRHTVDGLLRAHGLDPVYLSLDAVVGQADAGAQGAEGAEQAGSEPQQGPGADISAAGSMDIAAVGSTDMNALGGSIVQSLGEGHRAARLATEHEGNGEARRARPAVRRRSLLKKRAGDMPPQDWEVALQATGGAISLLGMVEEEVAVRSSIFFATTGYSSMAGMVIQQRHAQGSPSDATITFDVLGTLDPDKWPQPWSAGPGGAVEGQEQDGGGQDDEGG